MKKNKRIIIWAIVLCISAVGTLMEDEANKPKKEVTAYVCEVFKEQNDAIEKHFRKSSLGREYSLKVSNKQNVKDPQFIITEDFSEISSTNYEVIGKSPLIVVMKKNKKNIKKIVATKKLLAVEKAFVSQDRAEIRFKRLMEAVIKDKSWEIFGIENKKIKIYYPELTSLEGKLFYQFLLITANDGSYPKEEDELKTSQEYVEEFLEKANVKGVDVMTRLTGVNDIENDIYVTFENNALQLDSNDYSDKIYIAYPTETIEKRIYFQSNTQIGNEMFDKIGDGGFSYLSIEDLIKNKGYRIKNAKHGDDSIYGTVNFKESYNPVEISEE